MEAEDLDLPRIDGPGKPGQFRDLDAIAPSVEAIQGGAGCSHADRSVDRAQQLFALPGCGDLTGGSPAAVAGFQRASWSAMNASMSSRRACSSSTPRAERN
jgi:hypothetical protein